MFEFLSSILKMLVNNLFVKPMQKASWYKNVYRPQVKAKKNPYTTCFSHCTSWFLQNVTKKYTDKNLDPDKVTEEINSYKYQNWTRDNLGQWTLNRFVGNLNQLWDVERQYIEDKLEEAKETNGRKVIFDYNTSSEKIKESLKNSPVIVNTTPTYKGRKLGHIMLIVDWNEEKDEWVIDDPFGTFFNEYKNNLEGNDIHYPVKEFDKKYRGKMSIYLA